MVLLSEGIVHEDESQIIFLYIFDKCFLLAATEMVGDMEALGRTGMEVSAISANTILCKYWRN